jgi:histidinol-phosphatase
MLSRELGFANELADRAADIALPLYHGELVVRQKPDKTPVTEADIRIEQMVRSAVAQSYPADAVLGEEGGLGGPTEAERTWIVDPIDGTKNFARRIQIWGTLIALRIGDRFELGVVSAPALGERYYAVRGSGATLNGSPISVSDTGALPASQLLFAGVRSWLDGPHERAFLDLAAGVARTRGFGDFWGHMLVARGGGEAAMEPDLRVWDYAALVPIVEEAGGRISTFEGGPLTDGGSVLTSNGRVHDDIVARFARR